MIEAAGGGPASASGLVLPGSDLLDAMGFVRVVEVDREGGRVRAEFDVQPRFCHTGGTIAQGGFVTAWLDFTMAQAAIVRGGPGIAGVATLELKVSFLQRVGPGRVISEGRVQRMGRRVAFLEASLHDPRGTLLASASSTAIVGAG